MYNPQVMAAVTTAEHEILSRIAASGAITFAEFMEIALYHPGGYYPNRRPIGAAGDYFTSPVAHPTFGALICVQLHRMWETLGRPSPFWAIECGAGDGTLARDVTSFAREQMPEFGQAVRYVAVDRLPPASATDAWISPSWLRSIGLPLRAAVGCVLSNELFDAFPVHRFQIADGTVREVFVTVGPDDRFRDQLDDPSTPLIAQRIATLARELPEGYRGEVNLGVRPWVTAIEQSLKRGYVLTIDYGFEAEELYSDDRHRGTLQTYYRHTDGSSPYQRVGRQDLTAHVDFTSLIEIGQELGLRPVFLTTQAEYLHSLGFEDLAAAVRGAGLDRQTEVSNLRAMNQLVRPAGLGRFRVLVQEKNSGITQGSDLVPPPGRSHHVTPPLLTDRHLPPSYQQLVTTN